MAKHTLAPDPNNANRGTVRGLGQVERSLQQYGAGQSILASSDGVILAGNKTYDRAVELGIPVQEIESDGNTLFVIKRTDLPYDDPRAKELAIADNRASEVGLEWDAEVLTALADDGVDLEQFWFPEELADVLTDNEPVIPEPSLQEEPRLISERFVEINLSTEALEDIQPTLEEWSKRGDITINIS